MAPRNSKLRRNSAECRQGSQVAFCIPPRLWEVQGYVDFKWGCSLQNLLRPSVHPNDHGPHKNPLPLPLPWQHRGFKKRRESINELCWAMPIPTFLCQLMPVYRPSHPCPSLWAFQTPSWVQGPHVAIPNAQPFRKTLPIGCAHNQGFKGWKYLFESLWIFKVVGYLLDFYDSFYVHWPQDTSGSADAPWKPAEMQLAR